MDGMTTLDTVANILGFTQRDEKSWFTIGKVTAVNGSTLKVILGGSDTATDVEAYYYGAKVGDIVIVAVVYGQPRAIGVRANGMMGHFDCSAADFRAIGYTGGLWVHTNDDLGYGQMVYQSENRTQPFIRLYPNPSSTYGDDIVMGDGGAVYVGGGESPLNVRDALGYAVGTEKLILTSDNQIELYTNCDTVANRKPTIIANDGSIELTDDDIDLSQSNNGISADKHRYLSFRDKNGYYESYIGRRASASGDIRLSIAARNRVSGANSTNGLWMQVDKDGTHTVGFNSPLAWMDGLSASGSCYSTTTASDVLTADAGATISSVQYVQWGRLAHLKVQWNNSNAISVPASGNISNYSIATLKTGKRPWYRIHPASDGDNGGGCFYSIGEGGLIAVGGFDSTGAARTIAANTTHVLAVTYLRSL